MNTSVIIKAFLILALCSACYAEDGKCHGRRCRSKVFPVERLSVCGFIHKLDVHAHCFTEKCTFNKDCPNQLTCQEANGCEFISNCEEIPATDENKPDPPLHYCAVPSNKRNALFTSFWHCHTRFICDPTKKKTGCNPDFDCISSDECNYFIPCRPIENPFFDEDE